MRDCADDLLYQHFSFFRELLTGEKRYLTGLDQLAIASKSVAALQVALEILQPKLAAGAAAVAETTAKVEKEKEGVALIEADVLIDQAAAEEQVRLLKLFTNSYCLITF